MPLPVNPEILKNRERAVTLNFNRKEVKIYISRTEICTLNALWYQILLEI